MRKKSILLLVALFCAVVALAGCGGKDPLAKGKISVTLWGWADEAEAASMTEIVDWYNRNGEDGVYINYQSKPASGYGSLIDRTLAGNKGPDIFYVGDGSFKRWAKLGGGLLANLQPYVDASDIDLDGMWTSAVQRYRYNPEKNTSNADDPLYGLPKDISTTAIYYNASVMERQGIKVISVDEENLNAFNHEGAPDNYGKTKADYGITWDVNAKGFDRENFYKNGQWTKPVYRNGTVREHMVFNNRIAMSWEEFEDLSMILTRKHNDNLKDTDTTWGCYTEWWFYYGWSVGGDCAIDTTGNGDWKWTLGDKTQKRIVFDKDGEYVYGSDGKNIFVHDGDDGKYYLDNGKEYVLTDGQTVGPLLASQYEAFTHFMSLAKPMDIGGLEVAPGQTKDVGGHSPTDFFMNGRVGMQVQTSYAVSAFRRTITGFEWDIAPLPVYKTYGDDGVTVEKKGVEIGHSSSSCYAIWSKSKNIEAAFKAVKYLSCGEAQRIVGEKGYLLPNNRVYAQEEYIKKNEERGEYPKNIKLFVEVADRQRPGDWWYMPDNLWIDIWSGDLNANYREDNRPLDDFFSTYTDTVNGILKGYKTNGVL